MLQSFKRSRTLRFRGLSASRLRLTVHTSVPHTTDDCSDSNELVLLAEGKLAVGRREPIARHLRICDACRDALDAITECEPSNSIQSSSTRLGTRYRLEQVLNSGGAGILCSANDTLLNRTVAVKILRDVDSSSHLLDEAVAQARFRHPNVLSILDAGSEDGQNFIVLELANGEDAHSMALRQTLTKALAKKIAQDAATGLHALHAEGMCHGDVTPGNLLVAPNGETRIADFGLASDSKDAKGGTPGFRAPEVLDGILSPASDQYGLGQTLRYLLDHCQEPWPLGRDVAARACAADPSDRYHDMLAMCDALSEQPPRWFARPSIVVPALVGLCAAAVVGFLLLSNDASQRPLQTTDATLAVIEEGTLAAFRHGNYEHAAVLVALAESIAASDDTPDIDLRAELLSIQYSSQVDKQDTSERARAAAMLAQRVSDPELRAAALATFAIQQSVSKQTASFAVDLAGVSSPDDPFVASAMVVATEGQALAATDVEEVAAFRQLVDATESIGETTTPSEDLCESLRGPIAQGMCYSIQAAAHFEADKERAIHFANIALAELEPHLASDDCDLQFALLIRGSAQLATNKRAAYKDLGRAQAMCPDDTADERAVVTLQYARSLIGVGRAPEARRIARAVDESLLDDEGKEARAEVLDSE